MKGTIQPDHIPVNKYDLLILGMPNIRFTEVSGIEEELEIVDLPDRTKAPGGHTKPVEFTANAMMHHTVEQAAMELWFQESQDPVSPTYKKVATLIHKSLTGRTLKTYTLTGLFPSKRGLPDLAMENEGDAAQVVWTFSANDVLPV